MSTATRNPQAPALTRNGHRRTIDEVLADARTRIDRLTPRDAWAAVGRGALLVDIRPAAQRAAEGTVPAALVIERNVLEWRLDPASDHRIPQATGYDVHVVVLCSEGYTSSLAADALVDLGLHRSGDVVGGFHAWRAAGLPTTGGVPDDVASTPWHASALRDGLPLPA